MWFRTTLVFRDAEGWELLELGEPTSKIENLEGEIYAPESVVEVLTIAHAHSVASQQLGFTLRDGEQAPYFDADVLPEQAGDDEPGEQQEGLQPVQEAPAELPDAEPLDEERIVPYTDESTVTVDGTILSYDNSLKALRAGCQASPSPRASESTSCCSPGAGHFGTGMVAISAYFTFLRLDTPKSVPLLKSPQMSADITKALSCHFFLR